MTTSTTICAMRHGETDWNAGGILQGWIDVPINAKGRRQARDMAAHFQGMGFKRVWSSPLIRALETAQIIGGRLGLAAPRCHDGLMERNFGIFQGIPKIELAELNPMICQQIVTRNPACHFEEGETMDEFADRILAALVDIGRAQPDQRILLITHGWVIDVITRHVRGLPRSTILHTKPKNGESLWLTVSGESITADPASA